MPANVERSETYAMSTVSIAMHLPQPYVAIAAEIFAVHVFSGSMIVAEYGIVSLVRTVRARDESESVSPFNILFLSAFSNTPFRRVPRCSTVPSPGRCTRGTAA